MGLVRWGHSETRVPVRQRPMWESDHTVRKQWGRVEGPADACGLVYRHCQWSEGGSVRWLVIGRQMLSWRYKNIHNGIYSTISISEKKTKTLCIRSGIPLNEIARDTSKDKGRVRGAGVLQQSAVLFKKMKKTNKTTTQKLIALTTVMEICGLFFF